MAVAGMQVRYADADGVDAQMPAASMRSSTLPSADALQQFDERQPARRHLLLVAPGIDFIDLAGARLLAQVALDRLCSAAARWR